MRRYALLLLPLLLLLPDSINLYPPRTAPFPANRKPARAGGVNYVPGFGSGGSSLLTQLVAYWKLDETSGTRAKTAGSCASCDLSAVNAPLAVGGAGQYGMLTTVNTSGVKIADNASLSHAGTAFSYILWVQPSSTSTSSYFIAKTDAGFSAANLEFGLKSTGVAADLGLVTSDGAVLYNPQMTLAGVLTANTRVMVAAKYDLAQTKFGLSVNGAAFTLSGAWAHSIPDGANSLGIGIAGDDGNGKIGTYGPVVRWNRALSDADVAALYNSGLGYSCANIPAGQRTNLVACWDLTEASGTRAASAVGSCGSPTCDLSAVNAPGRTAGLVGNGMGMSAQVVSTSSQNLVTAGTPLTLGSTFTYAGWNNPGTNVAGFPAVFNVMGGTWSSQVQFSYHFTNTSQWDATPIVGGSTSPSQVSGIPRETIGAWYFAACWYDNTGDRKLRCALSPDMGTTYTAAAAVVGTIDGTARNATVGYAPSTLAYFNGAIDAQGIWGRVLTSTEISALYAAGAGVEYPWSAIVELWDRPTQWADRPIEQRQRIIYAKTGVIVPAFAFPRFVTSSRNVRPIEVAAR